MFEIQNILSSTYSHQSSDFLQIRLCNFGFIQLSNSESAMLHSSLIVFFAVNLQFEGLIQIFLCSLIQNIFILL